MLFNSIDFAIFIPIVFFLYWFVTQRNLKAQNFLIVIASYLFYGWWDWRFLFLIVFSTLVDFSIGNLLRDEERIARRKLYLWISICINLGFLGFFKYYNFFLDSFVDSFSFFGAKIGAERLNIILPVGISFYTFQTLSYTIDVYKKKLEPTKDLIAFTAFVSFFPQLVAGPIERATNLLPQILKSRKFSYEQSVAGLKLILWGLFKKMVIADSLGPIVDDVFLNSANYSSTTLVMGAVFFGFQIYGDFSGYSDIAIGTSKLFGIELKSNFKFPYFSRNIGEFWRRWHISLSTWFRDYLYIPLGGSRGGSKGVVIRNVLVIFVVSGFWHGANWTFVVWGVFHALLFVPSLISGKNRRFLEDVNLLESIPAFFAQGAKIFWTFTVVTIGWIFFRSDTIESSFSYLNKMFFDFSHFTYLHPRGYRMVDYFILVIVFVLFEYIIRKDERNPFLFKNKYLRLVSYIIIVISLLLFYDDGVDRSFIYFQF